MAVKVNSLNARRALEALGKNIKTARLKRRISVKGFAERVGVSESTITRLEKGDDGVSIGTLAMACLVLGEIERIDMVKREGQNGKPDHQRVFIHFKKWYSNETADHAREILLDERNIKVVYDEPWFWKIWASKSKKPTGDKPKKGSGKAPFVDFS